jgi:cell division protein ZapA (FtsZ GTPase activity inhibitor)
MELMNNISKTLKISILGKSYTVVTDEHDVDVFAAASQVDKIFGEKGFNIAANQGPLAEKLAAVVALQVAIELVKAQKTVQRYEHGCAGLMGMIEKNV